MSDLNKCYVHKVVLEKHPDADTLSLVNIEGYTVVVRTEDFKNTDVCAFVFPDNVVPVSNPLFSFLADKANANGRARITARKFRGVMSQGLAIPLPATLFPVGRDLTETLGVERWVSEYDRQDGAKMQAGENEKSPKMKGVSKYDIESYFKYSDVIPEGIEVYILSKIHGSNWRGSFQNGKFYVGSRNLWKRNPNEKLTTLDKVTNFFWEFLGKHHKVKRETNKSSDFWRVFEENSWVGQFLKAYPDVILYGEMYGWVQDLRYGANPGQLFFRAFDVYDENCSTPTKFWNKKDFVDKITVNGLFMERIPPIAYQGPYSKDLIDEYINSASRLPNANHIEEGIVITPAEEMTERRLGRVLVKAVSPEYLAKQGK